MACDECVTVSGIHAHQRQPFGTLKPWCMGKVGSNMLYEFCLSY